MQEMHIQSLGWEDPLEMEMVTHSSILAWEIPWTEEPGQGRLLSMGSLRVRHELAAKQQTSSCFSYLPCFTTGRKHLSRRIHEKASPDGPLYGCSSGL